MNDISYRFTQAIEFVKKNGYEKSDAAIGRRIGFKSSAICMAKYGNRAPSWEMLLNFCDAYPISFEWLRTGDDSMIKGERELRLLKKIEELEGEILIMKKKAEKGL